MFCKWRVHSSLSLQTVHLLPEQRQGDCSRAGEETGVGDEVPAPGSRDTPHRPCLGSEREAGCAHTHVPVSEAERKGNIPSLLAGVGHRWGGGPATRGTQRTSALPACPTACQLPGRWQQPAEGKREGTSWSWEPGPEGWSPGGGTLPSRRTHVPTGQYARSAAHHLRKNVLERILAQSCSPLFVTWKDICSGHMRGCVVSSTTHRPPRFQSPGPLGPAGLLLKSNFTISTVPPGSQQGHRRPWLRRGWCMSPGGFKEEATCVCASESAAPAAAATSATPQDVSGGWTPLAPFSGPVAGWPP